MLHWAIIFLIIAIVAAIFGFGGLVTGTALWVAKLLVVVFVILFIASLVTGRNGSNTTI